MEHRELLLVPSIITATTGRAVSPSGLAVVLGARIRVFVILFQSLHSWNILAFFNTIQAGSEKKNSFRQFALV